LAERGVAVGVEDVNVVSAVATEAREQSIGFICDQDVYENDQAEAKQHRLMESAFLKCFSFLCQSQLSENW